MARISDPIITRRGDVVPGDKQEQPADGSTSTVTFTDGTDVNWGDAVQHALLRMADDLGQVGTLANRPTAGSDEPIWWLVTDGGANDLAAYLSYNDGSEWHVVGDIAYRGEVSSVITSTYNISYGESLWVQANSGPVTVQLPAPKSDGFLQVIVQNAADDVTIARDGTETIDGNANDLIIRTKRAVTLTSDGNNWQTASETQGSFATGTATLSSGSATVDTGVATSTASDYFVDVALRPENAADIAASLEDDSGGTGNWQLHLEENTTNIGNPSVGWKLYPV